LRWCSLSAKPRLRRSGRSSRKRASCRPPLRCGACFPASPTTTKHGNTLGLLQCGNHCLPSLQSPGNAGPGHRRSEGLRHPRRCGAHPSVVRPDGRAGPAGMPRIAGCADSYRSSHTTYRSSHTIRPALSQDGRGAGPATRLGLGERNASRRTAGAGGGLVSGVATPEWRTGRTGRSPEAAS